MKTKHAKGKWDFPKNTYHGNIENGFTIYIRTDGKIYINEDGSESKMTICGVYGKTVEEVEANAKVIASVLDLLEALNFIRNLIDKGDLVRNISKDEDFNYFFQQGLRIQKGINLMNNAIEKAI